MNDIPAAKPDTMSVYLQADGKKIVELAELYVSDITVLPDEGGALIWVDPIGHVQISEQVLVALVHEHAKRVLVDAGIAEPQDDGRHLPTKGGRHV